ncbi:hypothetical protein GQX74_015190 [Glossina fuscipes]|nr:hypothetical protein GQX74_015190 [Glossina fuscipes]
MKLSKNLHDGSPNYYAYHIMWRQADRSRCYSNTLPKANQHWLLNALKLILRMWEALAHWNCNTKVFVNRWFKSRMRAINSYMKTIIKNTDTDDAGIYLFHAVNNLGENTSEINLIIKAPPKIKKITDVTCKLSEAVCRAINDDQTPDTDYWAPEDKLLLVPLVEQKTFRQRELF